MKKDNTPADAPENASATGAAAAPDELDRLAAQAAVDETPAPDPNAPPEPELPPTKVIVEMLLTPGFALLAPNWNVGKGEIAQLSECYAAVIDKHFPDGLGNFGPELAACVVTLAILAPRLNTPRKLPEKKTEAAADAEG